MHNSAAPAMRPAQMGSWDPIQRRCDFVSGFLPWRACSHAKNAAPANIAMVEGVDVHFVGPADLRHDLENNPSGESPAYEDCLDGVIAAVRSAGKESGILVRDAADVAVHLARGFSRIAVDSDLSILRKAYQALLSTRP